MWLGFSFSYRQKVIQTVAVCTFMQSMVNQRQVWHVQQCYFKMLTIKLRYIASCSLDSWIYFKVQKSAVTKKNCHCMNWNCQLKLGLVYFKFQAEIHEKGQI